MNTTVAANKPSSLIPACAIVRHWTTPRCQSRTLPGRQSVLTLAQQTNKKQNKTKTHKQQLIFTYLPDLMAELAVRVDLSVGWH